MRKGKLSDAPPSAYWLDWRVLMKEVSTPYKLMAAVAKNTMFFDFASKNLPVKNSVLNWVAKNHFLEFEVIVMGEDTGCIDQLLNSRLRKTWVKKVYWVPNFQGVLDKMKHKPWVLGFLTTDQALLDESRHVFRFTGPSMDLSSLPVG